ncbi:VWA domain-containing protein [Candidatus Gracilibacteria bacterium]|nr:VWA domain-containing protein [Candidatus Gracilibacteria bacterium]
MARRNKSYRYCVFNYTIATALLTSDSGLLNSPIRRYTYARTLSQPAGDGRNACAEHARAAAGATEAYRRADRGRRPDLCRHAAPALSQQPHNIAGGDVYFPLPADAAVTALEVQLPDRVIRGGIEERAQAQKDYREAADRGQGAALLEQERANLFTLSLANIQPGADVEVLLRFHARVPYDDERYRLSFPTVVLPRYMPASHDEEDAARVGNTPLLPEDSRAGHTISLSVQLDAGKVTDLRSPSHTIDVEQGRGSTEIRLRNEGEIPNRDFVLSYRTAGTQEQAALFSYRAAGQPGTLLLTLTPRLSPPPQALIARELLFVFDRSGSMGGSSIEQARNALHACLRTLNPGDVFNIFPFDNVVEQFAPQPLPFTQENVDRADAFIEGINARGGTEILGAIRAPCSNSATPSGYVSLCFGRTARWATKSRCCVRLVPSGTRRVSSLLASAAR